MRRTAPTPFRSVSPTRTSVTRFRGAPQSAMRSCSETRVQTRSAGASICCETSTVTTQIPVARDRLQRQRHKQRTWWHPCGSSMELLRRRRLNLGRLLDAALTELNRKQLPGRLLESLVHDLSEEEIFPIGGRDDKPIGVYVHVPFCPTKCAFCGYSVEFDRSESVRTQYAHALGTHLRRLAKRLTRNKVAWVSFGGGTPSTL